MQAAQRVVYNAGRGSTRRQSRDRRILHALSELEPICQVETNDHTRRAVIRIVPISASNPAFWSVMAGV